MTSRNSQGRGGKTAVLGLRPTVDRHKLLAFFLITFAARTYLGREHLQAEVAPGLTYGG